MRSIEITAVNPFDSGDPWGERFRDPDYIGPPMGSTFPLVVRVSETHPDDRVDLVFGEGVRRVNVPPGDGTRTTYRRVGVLNDANDIAMMDAALSMKGNAGTQAMGNVLESSLVNTGRRQLVNILTGIADDVGKPDEERNNAALALSILLTVDQIPD